MKRIVTTLLTLAFVLVLGTPVSAAHFWKFETSEPAATSQNRTFNLEFKTLSTDPADEFTVKLFQNGSEVNSTGITTDYGDSGVFSVTVPTDGVYQFYMSATSSVDSTTLTSTTRNVEVKGREVQVVSTDTTTGAAGGVQGATAGVAGDTNGDGVVDERDVEGQVDEGAASDETNEDVLGQEDKADSSTSDWLWAIFSALAILAAAYYWFYYRVGRINPFDRNHSDDV